MWWMLLLVVVMLVACEAPPDGSATSTAVPSGPVAARSIELTGTTPPGTTKRPVPTATERAIDIPGPGSTIASVAPTPSVTQTARPLATPRQPRFIPGIAAQVVIVVDGDTIVVLIDGRQYRVRYIGVDTPETVHPTRGVEPYGPEASAARTVPHQEWQI